MRINQKVNLAKLSSAQQIEVLKGLSQGAAAWLAGVSPRALRDQPELHRDEHRRYDARDVVKLARSQPERAKLSDDEIERLLLVVEELVSFHDDDVVVAVAEFLERLRSFHGDAGLLTLMDELVEICRGRAESERQSSFRFSAEAARQAEDVQKQRRAEQDARIRLDVATECARCGKVRRGRRWVQADPPEGYVTVCTVCPPCEKKHGAYFD